MRIAIQIQKSLLERPDEERPLLRDFSLDEIARELLESDSEILLAGAPLDDQGPRVSLVVNIGSEPALPITVLAVLLKQGALAESPNVLFSYLQQIWRRICQALAREKPEEQALDTKKQGEELDF